MKALGYWLSAAWTVFLNSFLKGLPTGGAIGTSIEVGVSATSTAANAAVDFHHKLLWAGIHTVLTAAVFGGHAVIAWATSHPIPNPFPDPAKPLSGPAASDA